MNQAPTSTTVSLLAHAYSLFRRGAGEPYTQAVFRHFLAVERKRAEQSQRPVLVALVSLHAGSQPQRISRVARARIFTGLARTVREVDFVGWYVQDYVAAAVLVQGTALGDVTMSVEERVRRAVCGQLSGELHQSVRVRIRRLTRKVPN